MAHSSMLLLALAAWEGHPQEEQRHRLMAELAAGVMRQQRTDGSFQVGRCAAYATVHMLLSWSQACMNRAIQ